MIVIEIIVALAVVFSAIILHEVAHGWVAYKLGDPTAKGLGRLSLNPIKHIDLVGTLLLPGILLAMRFMGYGVFIFGWAKPVPVNFSRLKNPKRDMILVGAAGPIVNLSLAFIFSRLIHLGLPMFLHDVINLAVFINLLLAVFNLMPIPPLDGSRVIAVLLPRNIAIQYMKLEKYGLLIVIVVFFFFGLFDTIVIPIVKYLGYLLGVRF